MNWLLAIVGMIVLVSFIVGLSRGAIKIIVSLVATLATLALTCFLAPYLSDAVINYTPLDEVIEEHVTGVIADAALELMAGGDEESTSEGTSDGAGRTVAEGLENGEIPRDTQIAAIENSDFPELFKHLLSANNNNEVYQQLGVQTFVQYVGSYLARLIVNILSFLCAFLLITVVIRAIVFALDIVSSLPGIGFINRLAGGILGIAGALIIVWMLYIIITLLYSTSIGKELFQMIQSDQILSILYEHNPIMKLATGFY